MPIRILPPEVASQIAAGEVVERPASVVKELLENSLDAGATKIEIESLGAGRTMIEVADDGCGISSKELKLAIERHATSKLWNADDLFHINTLGFRGEALASIGSVSALTITSRTKDAEVGARLRVEGGKAGDLVAIGAPVGTIIRVENLFYNVPARLKFLKHESTERHQIDTLVTRYALAYPQVRFSLRQETRPALQTTGSGSRREVFAALYGAEIARQMLTVSTEDEGLTIEGFVSPTSLTRSNRREIIFFVNGRPVQDAALISAILKAYHTLLMVGRYPQAILFIDVLPENVDVNVHPTKAEVRFREPDRIFSSVQRAVRRALLAHTPIPGITQPLQWSPPSLIHQDDPAWSADEQAIEPRTEFDRNELPLTQNLPITSLPSLQTPISQTRVPILRLVGQIASAYLVAEAPDGLYLIDQHAAHERILFEKFMTARSDQIPAQVLLQPVTFELPAYSKRLLDEQLPVLSHLGFEVEPFGQNTYLIRSIPAILAKSDPVNAVRVLVEDFEEDETPLGTELEARIIARICKRAAVKAGQTLTSDEQRALLEELERCQSPRTCPHGRPTMIHLSVELLERQFGRRGAR